MRALYSSELLPPRPEAVQFPATCIGVWLRIKVNQRLPDGVNAVYRVRQIVARDRIANPYKLAHCNCFIRISIRYRTGRVNLLSSIRIINLPARIGLTQSIRSNIARPAIAEKSPLRKAGVGTLSALCSAGRSAGGPRS